MDDEEYTADAPGLAAFIHEHVTPLVYQQEKESRHHDAIVNQTLGEGLHAYKLEKLSRYETHLNAQVRAHFGHAHQAQRPQKQPDAVKSMCVLVCEQNNAEQAAMRVAGHLMAFWCATPAQFAR